MGVLWGSPSNRNRVKSPFSVRCGAPGWAPRSGAHGSRIQTGGIRERSPALSRLPLPGESALNSRRSPSSSQRVFSGVFGFLAFSSSRATTLAGGLPDAGAGRWRSLPPPYAPVRPNTPRAGGFAWRAGSSGLARRGLVPSSPRGACASRGAFGSAALVETQRAAAFGVWD